MLILMKNQDMYHGDIIKKCFIKIVSKNCKK